MKPLNNKTSKALVLYILLFSSVVTLILTAIQLQLDYKEGINVIQQRINQIKITNIDSLTQSLWTLDYSSIRIQLEGLERINDIIYLKLSDPNNKLIESSGKFETTNTITEKIPLFKKYRGKETPLGTLFIVATKTNLYKRLIDTTIVILISQAIKTFLVSTFVFFLFYYLVSRHLEKIARYSNTLNLSSGSTGSLFLDRKKSHPGDYDDLDLVVNSINTMSENIHSAYAELLENQSELADREAKFRAIFNAITDAVVFVDNQRHIIQTNPAFYSMFGYSDKESVGKTTLMVYANPDDYYDQGENRYALNSTPASPIYEVEYKRKDGTVFPGETLGQKVKLSDGTQIGFIGVVRDISARRKAENENQRLQNQLRQSQKMEAIGQLTGGIAHDFNNILTSILGFAELTMISLENSNMKELIPYIEQINIAGERARTLITQMLSFSRTSIGEPELINLPLLINEVTSLIRPAIPANIEITTEIDTQVPCVYMDKSQLHQVLMNLCINARDAIENNGTISINLSREHNSNFICNSCHNVLRGDFIKISIEDTGAGIDPAIIEKIFDPFMSTKDVGKGTGMGLSVVHGILHKHNSHITVETAINMGTRFNVYIPPSLQDNNNIPVKDDIEHLSLSTDFGQGKHVLIIDDEESIVNLLKNILESHGFTVTGETDSTKAFDIFNKENFDIVITDQTMPVVAGTDLIKKILASRPGTPIILCSGYSESINEEEALKLGCKKYIGKPIQSKILLKELHNILTNQDSV